MPNFGRDDDEGDCGCETFHACPRHRAEQQRRTNEERAAMRSQGINPDAEVTESLAGIVFAVEASPDLTASFWFAIQRIMFPARRGR